MRLALPTTVLALVLAGCGGGGGETVTVTETATQTQTQTQTTPAAAAPTGPVEHLAFFQTPSKNIACGMGTGSGVRCDIAQHSWQATPKPANCMFDWGNGTEVSGQQKGTLSCASDTLLNQGQTLAYGSTSEKAPFRCTSEEKGVTCTNTKTQHGFFLARDKYTLF